MFENRMAFLPEARSRSFPSHSLKPINQLGLLTQRSKRTLSLPASRSALAASVNLPCYVEEDEVINESSVEEGMDQLAEVF